MHDHASIHVSRYERILDSLEPGTLERYDREESGIQYGGLDEYKQDGGALGFSALERPEQLAILKAIDTHLPRHTLRIDLRTGTSYSLKHTLEKAVGFYVSNLQAKVAMRLLGYRRGKNSKLNPCYNISINERRAFDEHARAAAKDAEKQRQG